jgi:hypothetical protein
MNSTRALFASIGVSVSLVAAAALSLFAVSVVIAFGGWSAGLGESGPTTTLVLGPAEAPHAKAIRASAHADAGAVVLKAAAKPRPSRRAAEPPARAVVRPSEAGAVSHPAVVTAVPQHADPPPVVATPAPPAPQTTPTADGVRRAGEDLSSVVQNTGKALSDITEPLAPPVSSAVQKVVDLVADVLRRTTNGLGGALDQLAKKK